MAKKTLIKQPVRGKIVPDTVNSGIFNSQTGVDGTIGYHKKKQEKPASGPIARIRFWEIDFLRGCAIFLMVGFHWTVDRYFLKGYPPGVSPLLLSFWQIVTAGLFLLLVGISLTFKREPNAVNFRTRGCPGTFNILRQHNLRRGMIILGWGLMLTLITRMFLPKEYIIFGILHLIGMAVLISRPLLNLKTWNLAFGVLVIGLGIYLNQWRVTFPWLLWAGLAPEDFASIDYFPVFPWYGVILVGIFLGTVLYGAQGRNFRCQDQPPPNKIVQGLCFLGRNSLLIYLVHQPVLLVLVLLTGK
jgi:uncharacterized membrane protein